MTTTPSDPDLRNDLGALFLVRVTKTGVGEVALVPLAIEDMRVGRAQGEDRSWLIDRITSLCVELGTTIEAAGDRSIARPKARTTPSAGRSAERTSF